MKYFFWVDDFKSSKYAISRAQYKVRVCKILSNVQRLPLCCATSRSGDHSFCSSDCAGAEKHIIGEEEGDGGILLSVNAAGRDADFSA